MDLKRVFIIGNGESRKGFDLAKLRQHGTIYGCNAIYREFMPDVITAVDHGIMHEIYHAGVADIIPTYLRDWTKVPAMAYEQMILGGMDKIEAEKHLKEVLLSNERGNSKEFVMHGSTLSGIVEMIKQNGKNAKKVINQSSIKVSWITENDKSVSLTDIMKKDHGWACGASAGYVSIHREELGKDPQQVEPDEVYMIGHDLYSTNDKVNNMFKSTKHYVAKENGPTPAINWIRQWYTLADWNPTVKFIKINRFNDSRDKVNAPIEEWKELKNIVYADYSTLDNLA